MTRSGFLKTIIILFSLQLLSLKENCAQKTVDMSKTIRYTDLHKTGELKKRGEELWKRMEICDLCPRECEADRLAGERGDCRANSTLEIASYGPHYGEEPELVGRYGSGTIFFTNCAMRCVFCINHDISHGGYGKSQTIRDLANIMLELQRAGRHNINLVSPSHYIPHILLALDIAAGKGLYIPLVYNTHGWEKPEILASLDGVVDIYLSDFKYGCSEHAGKYSIGAHTYVDLAQKAHLEMQRQVGTAIADPKTGLMKRGIMIRHLVMPENVSCTKEVMEWIAENLPKNTYINLMSQYTPVFKASDYPEINRRITVKEYRRAINAATNAGLTNARVQGYR
jgi:putative pyruvate formate lyase activating enzyme